MNKDNESESINKLIMEIKKEESKIGTVCKTKYWIVHWVSLYIYVAFLKLTLPIST